MRFESEQRSTLDPLPPASAGCCRHLPLPPPIHMSTPRCAGSRASALCMGGATCKLTRRVHHHPGPIFRKSSFLNLGSGIAHRRGSPIHHRSRLSSVFAAVCCPAHGRLTKLSNFPVHVRRSRDSCPGDPGASPLPGTLALAAGSWASLGVSGTSHDPRDKHKDLDGYRKFA